MVPTAVIAGPAKACTACFDIVLRLSVVRWKKAEQISNVLDTVFISNVTTE